MKNLPTSNSILLCASLYAQVIQSPCPEANQVVVIGFEKANQQIADAQPVEPQQIRLKP